VHRLIALALLLLVTVACTGSPVPESGPPTPRTSKTTLENWPTYHRTASRSGYAPRGPSGALQPGWRATLDGPVYGEPLVVGGTLVAATEHNYVYGLRARTGAVLWRVHLGAPQPLSSLPCGNIDPLGITGTPAYDAGTGSVFVVAETRGGSHTLWALNAATGARRWHRSLDTQPDRDRLAEQQRTAVLVVDGRVITTFGGLAGDCGNYVGYVTSVATDGTGPVLSYAVPTAREGGIWAPPGAVLGPDDHVYVAVGNGAELHGRWDQSDSVVELSPESLRPLSVFAPLTWREDNANDLDLGSMSPAVVSSVDRLVIAGKRGVAYLLPPRLGGLGSAISSLSGCTGFGGAAVVGRTVLMPCKGENAVRALTVGRSSLRWSWTASGVYSSPVVADDKVYVADQQSGDLVVLDLQDGSEIQRLAAGPMPSFPSQIVSGDWVFVPTLEGVTAFRGS
jgi:outer membrane protein assembly factor BamB